MTLNFTDDMASPLFKQILSIHILFVSLFMREIVLHTHLVLLFQDLFPRRSSIKMYTITFMAQKYTINEIIALRTK